MQTLELPRRGEIAIAAISLEMLARLQATERRTRRTSPPSWARWRGQDRRHHPGAGTRRV